MVIPGVCHYKRNSDSQNTKGFVLKNHLMRQLVIVIKLSILQSKVMILFYSVIYSMINKGLNVLQERKQFIACHWLLEFYCKVYETTDISYLNLLNLSVNMEIISTKRHGLTCEEFMYTKKHLCKYANHIVCCCVKHTRVPDAHHT